MSFERLKNVLRRDPDPVASAGDEAQLHSRFGIANREELLVTMFVNHDGREVAAGCFQGGVGVASVEDFDGHVVDSAAMLGEVGSHIGAGFGADQDQSDASGAEGGNSWRLVGRRSGMEAELLGERSGGLSQVCDRNDHMVNAA